MTIANLNPAPFDFDENENENLIKRKRMISHNRTQKRNLMQPSLTDKVSKVLDSIHKNEEDDESNLADFSPPPPPTSIGSERRANTDSQKEGMQNLGPFSGVDQNDHNSSLGKQPMSIEETKDHDVKNYEKIYGDSQSIEEFYRKYVPNYSNANATMNFGSKPYNNSKMNQAQKPGQIIGNDALISKLNYMIHLLEEKQDERTNNVTEEVVLYSFLGIFIIFIVDSFSRIGKYVR